MLKFQHLLKEYKMDEASPFDRKVLKLIHKQILDFYIKQHEQFGDNFTVDMIIENIDLLRDIYDFLNDTMELGPSASQGFIDLLMSNFRADGDYDDLTDAVYTPKEQEPYEKIYSESSGVTPYLIENIRENYYDIPLIYDAYNDHHFAIGDQDEFDDALMAYYGEVYYDDSSVIDSYGEDYFIEYLEVGDADARMIASEEANWKVEDIDDDQLMNEIRHGNADTISLVEEYEELEEERFGNVRSGNPRDPQIHQRMGEIIDRARDIVREEIYDITYDRIKNNLKEYLWEMGYITKKSGDFYFSVDLRQGGREDYERYGDGIVDVSKIPTWLTFDREKFLEDEVGHFNIENLSASGSADSITIEGDTYYIIDVDY